MTSYIAIAERAAKLTESLSLIAAARFFFELRSMKIN